MKKHGKKLIAGGVVLIVLAAVFWWGGNSPSLRGWNPGGQVVSGLVQGTAETVNPAKTTEPLMLFGQAGVSAPEQEEPPAPMESRGTMATDRKLTCTLAVRCDTVLKNPSWLDPAKKDLVPENGVLFEERTVTFYEGESVFDLLLREMEENQIHMEYKSTPIYTSAYIQGIGNLYELDCGELSGWVYRVNGWFPNYGCSRYQLKEGDRVEWLYTCDLGADVGGYSAKLGGGE